MSKLPPGQVGKFHSCRENPGTLPLSQTLSHCPHRGHTGLGKPPGLPFPPSLLTSSASPTLPAGLSDRNGAVTVLPGILPGGSGGASGIRHVDSDPFALQTEPPALLGFDFRVSKGHQSSTQNPAVHVLVTQPLPTGPPRHRGATPCPPASCSAQGGRPASHRSLWRYCLHLLWKFPSRWRTQGT